MEKFSHARELVAFALTQGVAIAGEGGALRLAGPTARLAPEFIARLRAAKQEILDFLATCDERLTLRPRQDEPVEPAWSQRVHQRRVAAGTALPHLVSGVVDGQPDTARLAAAVDALLARHPLLAGTGDAGAAAVVVAVPFDMAASADGLDALAERHRPTAAQPFRVLLAQGTTQALLVLLALPHVADPVSLQLVLQALRGEPADTSPTSGFDQFAAAEARLLRHPAAQARRQAAALALGWDGNDEGDVNAMSFRHPRRLAAQIPAVQWDELHRLAAELAITPAALLAAYAGAAVALGGATRTLVCGLHLPNRRARATAAIVGPVEACVTVRMPPADGTLASYAATVQALHALAQDVQDLASPPPVRTPATLTLSADLADLRGTATGLRRAADAAVAITLSHTGAAVSLELAYDADDLAGADADLLHANLCFVFEQARALMRCELAAIPPAPEARAAYLRERRADPDVALGMLRTIFAAVLALPDVDSDGNFFELAGNSLSVAKIVSRVKREFGVAVSFSDVFRHPTPRGLAAVVLAKGAATLPELVHRAPLRELRASPQQDRYFASYNVRVGPSTRATVITGLWPSAAVIDAAVTHLVARHELLRTTFFEQDGRLMQRIAETMAVPCEHVVLDDGGQALQLRQLDAMARTRAFDLAAGPLVKLLVSERPDGTALGAVSVFNGILDAFSEAVLKDELALACELVQADAVAARPPLALQYQDFARWQAELGASAALEGARAYWTEQYPDDYASFHLPAPGGPRHGEMRVFLLGEALSGQVASAAALAESSLFGYLLGNFVQLGAEIYGRDDVSLGLLYHGRENEELEKQIGYFVDLLCLRCHRTPGTAFPELVRHVNQVLFRSIDMRLFQYQDLCARFGAAPTDPVFPITGYHINNVIAPGHEKHVPADFTGQVLALPYQPKFDFNIYVHESNRGILIRMAYATDVVDTARAAQLADRFIDIVTHNTAAVIEEHA